MQSRCRPSRRPNPRLYQVGDVVWACRQVKSDKKRERVDKLLYQFTGPWKITAHVDGASYEIQHCNSNRKDKKHAADLYPIPENMVPFMPVDGADNQYGQLYKPIGLTPYAEAGIKGFQPPQPFKASAHFASIGTYKDFHFPTLAELIDDITPYPWHNEAKKLAFYSGDQIETLPVLAYTGPPPQPPTYSPPTIPTLPTLMASIISSSDKLFFVSHSFGNDSHREWRLMRVAFQDSVAFYPSYLQDGRFLVEFYILHDSDVRFNCINQRYWLQYHATTDIATPTSISETHLIRPSDSSNAYAKRHKLVPFRQWINLTHSDTYIHGPFDFALINGRQSRDRVSAIDWDALRSHKDMFNNTLPREDLPTYSIHVDRGAHVAFCSAVIASQLESSAQQADHSSMYR